MTYNIENADKKCERLELTVFYSYSRILKIRFQI